MRCTWCDSEYTFTGGDHFSIDAIVEKVRELSCELVEVTGGEPLAQRESLDLIKRLCDENYEVLIETGGYVSTEQLDPRAKIILDVKCPASGEAERNHWPNLNRLREDQDEVRVTRVQSRLDFEDELLLAAMRAAGDPYRGGGREIKEALPDRRGVRLVRRGIVLDIPRDKHTLRRGAEGDDPACVLGRAHAVDRDRQQQVPHEPAHQTVAPERAVADDDPELEQLAADPLGAPEEVVARHRPDQVPRRDAQARASPG